jgi:hypothetical protein
MENNNLWIISIVAIVAIVGMVFMFSGNKVSYAPQGANYVYEDAQGDLAGQAIVNIKSTSKANVVCECDDSTRSCGGKLTEFNGIYVADCSCCKKILSTN